ncbi:MAG TPA: type II toxin-antitoxin system VapC family toxin [Lamprocystis sp. (in: g-proteobacteria)]|nr:type II toxin-antitoxin system VapC family toxin [Lamprocystis sp. (in: g-proteobacteria)]
MLDTNVVSEFARDSINPGVFEWLAHGDEREMAISVVSIGEIEKGIAWMPQGKRQRALQVWLERRLLPRFQARVLPLELVDLRLWGQMVGAALKAGTPLPQIDALIAAVAIQRDLTLVTRNTDDFKRTGVTLINPWR